MTLLPVLSSCRAVAEESQFVHIESPAISRYLDNNSQGEIPPLPLGPAPYHYFDNSAASAQWIFVLETVNHCFWPDEGFPRWGIRYRNVSLSGYWALAASLKRAMKEGISINLAETLVTLQRGTLGRIFRGTSEIPLLDERLANLRQVGQVLLQRFQGNFIHVLEEARGSAVDLVLLVAREFSSFNDTAIYHGETVYFFKRAQLLVQDLWSTFSGASWGDISRLEQLTAFADYKLPQVLRHLGIIRYEPELEERIRDLHHLQPGSPEEVEIRAATVWAVELLRNELERRSKRVTAVQLDNWLWHLGQEDTYRSFPYHRTRTIFY
ncbi:MAG: queuosine salvage family protein [Deltaproteobacteria bacterium]|nr:MAG: queuosine salvage family protein [Deltaproteobacteria bacterium]